MVGSRKISTSFVYAPRVTEHPNHPDNHPIGRRSAPLLPAILWAMKRKAYRSNDISHTEGAMIMIEHDTNTTRSTASTVRSSDGTTISYLSVGSGPAVIVVPGALSLASGYTAFARQLSEHFTVHTIELRRREQSAPPGNDYSITKECEDVRAFQYKTGASLLVGHSYGGLVALEFT